MDSKLELAFDYILPPHISKRNGEYRVNNKLQ